LKVKRRQQSTEDTTTHTNNDASIILVGQKDPEEFLDPFLETLMKEPVLLTSSGRICDRSIALQCILRGGGRDPFNGAKLVRCLM
jgi:hypothetical protein